MVRTTQATSQDTTAAADAHQGFDAFDIDSSSTAMARPLAMGSGSLQIGDRTESFDYSLSAPVDGKSAIELTPASGQELSSAGRFFGSIGAAVSGYLKKLAIAGPATAAGLGLIGTTEKAEAVLMQIGSVEADYRAMGSEMAGELLSLRISNGIGVRNASATYLNSEYVLTAAHNFATFPGFPADNIDFEVATGPNFNDDRGVVVDGASVMIYPGYDGTRNTPDMAIIHLATPLSGILATIDPAETGEVVASAGFGRPGWPGAALPVQDGYSRGWLAPVEAAAPIDASGIYYFSTFFGSSTHLDLNGKGTSGDSGGPVFDGSGNLLGINIAQSGDTSTVGTTIALRLSQPDVYSWIAENTAVPEPSTLTLLVLGVGAGGLMLRRQRNDSGD